MAVVTGAVIAGAAVVGSAVDSRNQRKSADKSSRLQAEGVQAGLDRTQEATERALPLIQQGFEGARETLNPLSQLAQTGVNEQFDLLGLSGQGAFNTALSRVSDPLVNEQERAFRRNSAAFGGVGGNVLSALAEQTRQRTEANIGNRLNQLAQASSPALNALQQTAAFQANQGTTEANTLIGQGSQLAQLSQNLGTAQAGGAAFRAQQAPIGSAINTGLGVFGAFGGATPPPQQLSAAQVNAGFIPTTANIFGRN